MQDIRLVGNDGEYLNLETQSGDKFRLVLDESLRAAVKRDKSVQLVSHLGKSKMPFAQARLPRRLPLSTASRLTTLKSSP
jgi:transposase